MLPVEMPKANENLLEATLNQWYVQEGQEVREQQALCQVITDKATFDLPAPAGGCVLKLLAPERTVLPVGYALCVLGAPGESVLPEVAARNERLLAEHRSAVASLPATALAAAGAPAMAPPVGGGAVRATPAARRLAKEHGLDLAEVARALGLAGPVGEKDVREFLSRKDQDRRVIG